QRRRLARDHCANARARSRPIAQASRARARGGSRRYRWRRNARARTDGRVAGSRRRSHRGERARAQVARGAPSTTTPGHRARVLRRTVAERDLGTACRTARHREDADASRHGEAAPGTATPARGRGMSDHSWLEHAAPYALGALDENERASFEAHLTT